MIHDDARPLLLVEEVSKSCEGRIGCADVSFDLYPGEVMGIVGESGSGKSTLLTCPAGHLAPEAGRVLFDTRVGCMRDMSTLAEPERRKPGRTDWAVVHQNARDGLRVNVSACGNMGERLMAVGARRYGNIRAVVLDLIRSAKGRGAAILGIFNDAAARAHVCDRCIDVSAFGPEGAA